MKKLHVAEEKLNQGELWLRSGRCRAYRKCW